RVHLISTVAANTATKANPNLSVRHVACCQCHVDPAPNPLKSPKQRQTQNPSLLSLGGKEKREKERDRKEERSPPNLSPSLWARISERCNSSAAGADDITIPSMTMPFSLFPFEDIDGTNNPYAMEMPLTDINWMTDLTLPFSNPQDPMFDYDSVYGKGRKPVQHRSDSNFIGLDVKQTHRPLDYSMPPAKVVSAMFDADVKPPVDRKLVTANGNFAAALYGIHQNEELNRNIGRPQLFRNFISDGVSTPVAGHTIDGLGMAKNNNFMTTEVQEDCPENLDVSFLTLGFERKTEDLSKSNRSETNVANNFGRDALPQPNTFYSRKEERNFFNPSDVAGGLPCHQNTAGGFNGLTNNMPQDDSQHHFVMPGNRNVALGVEGNRDTRSAYIDPSNCFQGYPDVSLIPVGSSSGLPDSGESRAYGLPSFSFSSTSTCPPAFETSRNLIADPGMVFPPIGATTSTSLHDQFGKPFATNEVIAVEVAERGDVPGKFRFSQLPKLVLSHDTPLAGTCLQRKQSYRVIKKLGNAFDGYFSVLIMLECISAYAVILITCTILGEEFLVTKCNRTAQGSSAFVGTHLKRVAEQPQAVTARAQLLKRRRAQSSVDPSAPMLSLNVSTVPNSSKASSFTVPDPTAPSLPWEAKSTTSLSPLLQISHTLPAQGRSTPLFPPLSQTTFALPTPVRRTAVLPALSQIASSLPSRVKTTKLHPPLSLTAPCLRPKAKTTTSHPALSQNAPSFLPLPQIAPRLASHPTQSWNAPSLRPQVRIVPPLPSQPWAAPPVPQISQNASPLPPKSQSASSLSPQTAQPPLPPPQIAPPLLPKRQTGPPSPSQPQTAAPPLPPQSRTASAVHIKWKGFGQTQPSGHKCLICKRDLSFTPEGPVSIPTIQPVVAVLPCGHTFHDHCLQLITPEDQAKSPPCIPCAIGDS
ncbi:hypothetical protein DVH24_031144, partial [Malus domestica]